MPGEIKVGIEGARTQLDALIKQLTQIKKLQSEIAQQGNTFAGRVQGRFQLQHQVEAQLQRVETQMRLLKAQYGIKGNIPEYQQLNEVRKQQEMLKQTLAPKESFGLGGLFGLLKRNLPWLAPVGMATWTYGQLKQGFGQYRQDAQQLSDLARNVKSAETSFADFRKAVLSAGDAIGYSNQQMAQLAQTYSSFVGKIGTGAFSEQLRMIGGFAKSYGMDLTQTGILFGQAAQMGVTQGVGASMTPQQFAGLLADAIAKGDMQGRQVELIESINSLVGQLQSQNVYAPNPAMVAGLLTTLNMTGIQGLRGMSGARLLSNFNNAITNPGGGVAGQYMMFRWLNPTGQLTAAQEFYLQQQGLAGVNPYTGQSNLAAVIQGSLNAFGLTNGLQYTTVNGHRILDPRSAQAIMQLSGMWNMSPAQAEAMLNTFAPGGKLNVAQVGGFTDWLTKQVGAQQANQFLQTGNIQMLADLYNAKNPQDVAKAAQTYLQMGGKLPQDWQNYLAGHSTQEDIQYLLKNVQGPGLTSADQLTKSFEDVNKAAENTASQFSDLVEKLNQFKQALLGNADQAGGGPSIPWDIAAGVGLGVAGKPLLRGAGKIAQKGLPWLARILGIGGGAAGAAAAGEAAAGGALAAGEAAAGAEAILGTGATIAAGEAATGIGVPVALGTLGLTILGAIGYGIWKKYHSQQQPAPQPPQPSEPAASYVGGNFDNYMAQLNQTPSMGVLGRIAAGSSGLDGETLSSLTIQTLTIGNLYRTGVNAGGNADAITGQGTSNLVYNPAIGWSANPGVYYPSGPISVTPLVAGPSAVVSGFSNTLGNVDPSIQRWTPYILKAARTYNIDPNLIAAVMKEESGGRQWDSSGRPLLSSTGAIGLMQLMPGTAQGLGVDPYDPEQNIMGGAKYLAEQISRFGLHNGLAAYNGGPGGIGLSQAQNYAATVEAIYRAFQSNGPIQVNVNLPPQLPSLWVGL